MTPDVSWTVLPEINDWFVFDMLWFKPEANTFSDDDKVIDSPPIILFFPPLISIDFPITNTSSVVANVLLLPPTILLFTVVVFCPSPPIILFWPAFSIFNLPDTNEPAVVLLTLFEIPETNTWLVLITELPSPLIIAAFVLDTLFDLPPNILLVLLEDTSDSPTRALFVPDVSWIVCPDTNDLLEFNTVWFTPVINDELLFVTLELSPDIILYSPLDILCDWPDTIVSPAPFTVLLRPIVKEFSTLSISFVEPLTITFELVATSCDSPKIALFVPVVSLFVCPPITLWWEVFIAWLRPAIIAYFAEDTLLVKPPTNELSVFELVTEPPNKIEFELFVALLSSPVITFLTALSTLLFLPITIPSSVDFMVWCCPDIIFLFDIDTLLFIPLKMVLSEFPLISWFFPDTITPILFLILLLELCNILSFTVSIVCVLPPTIVFALNLTLLLVPYIILCVLSEESTNVPKIAFCNPPCSLFANPAMIVCWEFPLISLFLPATTISLLFFALFVVPATIDELFPSVVNVKPATSELLLFAALLPCPNIIEPDVPDAWFCLPAINVFSNVEPCCSSPTIIVFLPFKSVFDLPITTSFWLFLESCSLPNITLQVPLYCLIAVPLTNVNTVLPETSWSLPNITDSSTSLTKLPLPATRILSNLCNVLSCPPIIILLQPLISFEAPVIKLLFPSVFLFDVPDTLDATERLESLPFPPTKLFEPSNSLLETPNTNDSVVFPLTSLFLPNTAVFLVNLTLLLSPTIKFCSPLSSIILLPPTKDLFPLPETLWPSPNINPPVSLSTVCEIPDTIEPDVSVTDIVFPDIIFPLPSWLVILLPITSELCCLVKLFDTPDDITFSLSFNVWDLPNMALFFPCVSLLLSPEIKELSVVVILCDLPDTDEFLTVFITWPLPDTTL